MRNELELQMVTQRLELETMRHMARMRVAAAIAKEQDRRGRKDRFSVRELFQGMWTQSAVESGIEPETV